MNWDRFIKTGQALFGYAMSAGVVALLATRLLDYWDESRAARQKAALSRRATFFRKALSRYYKSWGIEATQALGYDQARRAVFIAHWHAAWKGEDALNSHLPEIHPTPEQIAEYRRPLQAVAEKFSLPEFKEPGYDTKVDAILHELDEEGKLQFTAPDLWRVR